MEKKTKNQHSRPAKGLKRRVRDFAAQLQQDYPGEITRDASGFKCSVVRLVRLSLPPGPGRPADETITHALRLRAQNTPWLRVYQECIPGFIELEDGIRQLAMTRLRTAVRTRRNRRKQKPTELLPQKIPA